MQLLQQLNFREKQSIETRKRIYDAATELFIDNSYENVKVNYICKRANVSVGSFYHHFPSKEALLGEGYRIFDKKLEETFNEKVFSSTIEVIYYLIESQLSATAAKGVHYSIEYFKHQLTSDERYIINETRFLNKMVYEQVEKAIEEKGLELDAKEIAELVLCGSRGAIYDWCLRKGSYDIVEYGLLFVDILLGYYGLLPEDIKR